MSVVFVSRIPALTKAIERRCSVAVRKIATDISTGVKVSFAQPKSGRIYSGHQASAPGESPAIDTGLLQNSVFVENQGSFKAVVGVGAEYAVHLEFGTVKMEPRPFFVKQVESKRPVLLQVAKAIFQI